MICRNINSLCTYHFSTLTWTIAGPWKFCSVCLVGFCIKCGRWAWSLLYMCQVVLVSVCSFSDGNSAVEDRRYCVGPKEEERWNWYAIRSETWRGPGSVRSQWLIVALFDVLAVYCHDYCVSRVVACVSATLSPSLLSSWYEHRHSWQTCCKHLPWNSC